MKRHYEISQLNWALKGKEYYANKQYANAVQAFNHAIELNPNNVTLYNERGMAKRTLGMLNEAMKDFNQALTINPKDAIASYHLNSVIKESNLVEALKIHDRALELNPDSVDDYMSRGKLKYELGHFSEAVKDFDRAIKCNPNLASAYSICGRAKEALGQRLEAIQYYDRALDINPQSVADYINRGIVKKATGQLSQAEKDFDFALQLDPKYAGTYINRGNLKLMLGKFGEAFQDFDNALKLDPSSVLAYMGYEAAKKELNNIDKQGVFQQGLVSNHIKSNLILFDSKPNIFEKQVKSLPLQNEKLILQQNAADVDVKISPLPELQSTLFVNPIPLIIDGKSENMATPSPELNVNNTIKKRFTPLISADKARLPETVSEISISANGFLKEQKNLASSLKIELNAQEKINKRLQKAKKIKEIMAREEDIFFEEGEEKKIGDWGEQIVFRHLDKHYQEIYQQCPNYHYEPTPLGFEISCIKDNQPFMLNVKWENKNGEKYKSKDFTLIESMGEQEMMKHVMEVKATLKKLATYVNFSGKELKKMEKYGNRYHIFIVYNVGNENPEIKQLNNPYNTLFGNASSELPVESIQLYL
jgi:tetratricopeptide (TPR) repeat protein